ncbi:TIGR03862 family flavoprotein [Marinomonas sp. 15G1-11]|uniref:TIGR03862 family flavoprotein n=1 Tax=Marinomonas phaeophyticola TaxID=3004091 RepID=A0ABT4JNY9_9GAMM|nr:TIGR03862 family flavoprotein [Marinomonas sp. 15G1-11]MCZ2720082.1 TIGR03862 family flavoprotein [Marinomonas sp. 15G1-11]
MSALKAQKVTSHKVVVIGAGPAGLMAAERIASAGYQVDIYDAMPSVARKFLLAGKGGMNITHSEADRLFRQRFYEANDWVSEWLNVFNATDLRDWLDLLGVETFIGTSGRVFPIEMKAAPLLRKWVHRLKQQGVEFHVRHKWLGWQQGCLHFKNIEKDVFVDSNAVLLALGGASWPALGSDAQWVNFLVSKSEFRSFRPANSGFECKWSQYFADHNKGKPIKGVCISLAGDPVDKNKVKGEVMVDEKGLEGSLVYAHSASIRNRIEERGYAEITIDLMPDLLKEEIVSRLNQPKGKMSLSSFMKKKLKLDSVKSMLLRERLSNSEMQDSKVMASYLKAFPLVLTKCFDIEHAISSAGGVKRSALTKELMLINKAGVFCSGEMLDWEAPTGGYLLTASMASGYYAANGLIHWLNER